MNLDDLHDHIARIKKMGVPPGLVVRVPGLDLPAVESARLKREAGLVLAMIDAMTPEERQDPSRVDDVRLGRIADAAGVEPESVRSLLDQFDQMKSLTSGS